MTLGAELGRDGKPCRVCDQFKDWTKGAKNQTIAKLQKEKVECPPDSVELGRHTWTFLHTMAAYFPESPTNEQKINATQFLNQFSQLYPCGYCAEHLQSYIKDHPPTVDSNHALSSWMCIMHNDVNERLGKPKFDCKNVFKRWRDGPNDGTGC